MGTECRLPGTSPGAGRVSTRRSMRDPPGPCHPRSEERQKGTPAAETNLQSMIMTPARYRVVIGAYDDAETLWPTVTRLLGDGVHARQLGVAARADRLVEVSRSPVLTTGVRDHALKLVGSAEPLTVVRPSELTVVASRGPLYDGLIRHVPLERPAASAKRGPAPVIPAGLLELIRTGSVALAVTSDTPAQQWATTRILLDSSVHPVQTHDYAGALPVWQS